MLIPMHGIEDRESPPRTAAFTDFTSLLRLELARRSARNPRYSMRAFARALGVDHSTLSQWIRGRRPITKTTIQCIGPRLGLSAAAIRVYAEYARIDAPDALVLQLTRAPEFRPDTRWIATTLAISVDDANMAVQRLLRLGLLAMEEPDRWVTRWDAL